MAAMRARTVVNFAFFQIGWFACVLGAAHGRPWLGIAVTALAGVTAALMSGQIREVAVLAAAGLCVGAALETAMIASGAVSYAAPGPVPPLPPAWILALWVSLAINTNELLRWMHGRLGLQVALAAIGAPLSYLAGEKLGAMTFHDPKVLGIVMYAALWAAAFPALMAVAKRLSGNRPPPDVT